MGGGGGGGAQTEVEEAADQDDSPLLRVAERAAANIIRTARSLREAAAAVLIKLGYQIHALLCAPRTPPRPVTPAPL